MSNMRNKDRRFDKHQPRFKDSVFTKNRGWVRVDEISPDSLLQIQRGNDVFEVKASVIKAHKNLYTLDCGHADTGIAVSQGDTLFCDDCGEHRKVVSTKF